MRYLMAFLLLAACSSEVPIEEPQDADLRVFADFLNATYNELAVTYKVDAPALNMLGSEISMYKKNDIVKYEFNEFSYLPSTKRICSGEVCRALRPETDPDKKILTLSKVFSLNEESYSDIEYKGVKQAGERPCHRYYVPYSLKEACPDSTMDICIDQETTIPLYVTILCSDEPAIIWSLASVTNTVEASMFE